MSQRLTAPRALTALVARRAVRFATIIAAGITGIGIAVSATLVYFFSPWWWLLTVIFVLLFCLFLLARIISMVIVRVIYPNKFTREQKQIMTEFIDNVQEIIEAKSMPLFLMALICIKDILLHRDIVTIKKLIASTTSLHKAYREIEKSF